MVVRAPRTITALVATFVVVFSLLAVLPQPASGSHDGDIDDACPPGRVSEDGFTDVPDTNVHEGAIDCLVEWRVTTGTSATTYAPANPVRRDQMASFLARLMTRAGYALPDAPADAFGDDDGNTHEANIDKLADPSVGVVAGTGPGTYAPARAVSRAQMATFLVRTYETITGQTLPAGSDKFGDDDGNTHEANINKAAAAGFTGGLGDGRYGPNRPVRRDQMGSFLARLLDHLVENGYAEPTFAPTLEECLDNNFPSDLTSILQGLPDDGDPDGDGFTTGEERNELAFDPQADPTRFNPLVADVPVLGLDVVGTISIDLKGTVGTSETQETITIEENERTDERQDIDTTETTESHEVGVGAGGSKSGFELSADYKYTNSTTHTSGTILTSSERSLNVESLRNEFTAFENIDGGELAMTVRLSNPGHVDYKVDDLELLVTEVGGGGQVYTVGQTTPVSGFALTEGASTEVAVSLPDIGAQASRDLAADLSGLRVQVSSFQLTEIGKGDIRTDTGDFSQYEQRIRQNTTALTVDYGPDGGIESHLVSTTFRRNPDGTPAGTSLCEALGTVLGKGLEVEAQQISTGGSADVTAQQASGTFNVLTSLDIEEQGVRTRFEQDAPINAYWIANTNSASLAGQTPFDFNHVVLRANEAVQLVYHVDADDDLLPRIVETRRLGTSDVETNSDGDSLGDHEEATSGYEVVITGSGAPPPYEVFSDPASADADGDGWDDTRERAEGTDPYLKDTDGDTVDDPADSAPLDRDVGAELENPVAHWMLDFAGGAQPGGVYDDAEGNYHGSGCPWNPDDEHGPIADRNGFADRAWAAGRASFENDCGAIRTGHIPEFGASFTITGWIKTKSFSDEQLLAGEPGFMGLFLNNNATQLVLGEAACLDDCPPDNASLPEVSAPIDLNGGGPTPVWTFVAGSAAETTEGGQDGVRLRLYIGESQTPVVDEFQAGANLSQTDDCSFVLGMTTDCFGDTDSNTPSGLGRREASGDTGFDDVRLFDTILSGEQVLQLSRE